MNKFFKGAKAAVGVILAVAVALPTGLIDMVSAASDAAIKNPEDVTLADGVVLSKTAKAVDGAVNTWDVTLRVESPKTSTTSDTVIIIDRSGSMEGEKMSKAKEAAKTLAKQLLSAGNTANRVAVVSFAGDIETNVGFSDSYTTVAGAIDGLEADGGTYTQAAIRAAADLLGTSTANTKNNQIIENSLVAEANLMKDLDYPALPRIVDIIDDRYSGMACVVSLDTKYAPKLKMYSLKHGTTLECKIDRRSFYKNKLEEGDIVMISGSRNKPKMKRDEDGQFVPVEGTNELWITSYKKMNNI